MVALSGNHFLEIFEELITTRWAYITSQPEIAKPDWYQRGTDVVSNQYWTNSYNS